MRPLQNSPAIARLAGLPAMSGAIRGPVRAAGLPHPGTEPAPGDVEVSVRVHRDGSQITVVRRTDPTGMRTLGIEAEIR